MGLPEFERAQAARCEVRAAVVGLAGLEPATKGL